MACTVLSVFQRPALLKTNEIILFAVKLNKNEIFNALFQSHVRIWHGVSLSTYSVIGVGVFSGGIISIGFSNDVST